MCSSYDKGHPAGEDPQIPTRYNPKDTEDKWYRFWEEHKFFGARPDSRKKAYSIVIPPPNITGILHMGHALNNTIQDILIRWKRMQGFETEWLPGTDHAGIATQNVVERELMKEGIKRQDLGREKFLEKVWDWREKYGSTIIMQLKKLGCSCDWDRTRFTMDKGLSDAVLEVFTRLHKKGLIYQGDYIINWCPRCQTALSDEESQHKDIQGNLYYIKYPIKDTSEHVVVATTRPETMLGDTAVAINPKDKRFKGLAEKTVILPIVNRELKVIKDIIVDPEFGTGVVKVTPAHDPNDFLMGQKHKLEFVNVMNPDATMNENAGEYQGMDRLECREALLEDLKERDLLVKVERHSHAVGHCYRCHTMIEPYLSRQWFVKMKPLAKPGIDAVKKGKIKFYPVRWTKVYLEWMENIRDWCISRQIWWGHRIPVYYCKDCRKKGKGIIVSKVKPAKCPDCGTADIVQDEDVLDTWFSSWLWPFSTFGWPEKTPELKYFYPTSSLVTASEIIFFWVARMIMAGMEFMGEVPFKDVYIHGTVRDATGMKMSKSLGNIIDPLDIISEYGTDALRFSLISITAVGQDVFLSKEKFEVGRNFANKIWNASRFVLMNISDLESITLNPEFSELSLSLADKWILSRLNKVINETTGSLEKYRFNDAANIMYEFFWHDFCDWYVEIAKADIAQGGSGDKEKTAQVINYVLEASLRLLHPVMPFITEEIWQKLPGKTGESIVTSPWPAADRKLTHEKAEQEMDLVKGITIAVRNIRAEMNVPLSSRCDVLVKAGKDKTAALIRDCQNYIKDLAKLEKLEVGKDVKKPHSCATAVFEDIEIYVPLAGLIDIEAEKNRLMKKIQDLEKQIQRAQARLGNKEFLKKAPKEVVEADRQKHDALKETLSRLKLNLESLKT